MSKMLNKEDEEEVTLKTDISSYATLPHPQDANTISVVASPPSPAPLIFYLSSSRSNQPVPILRLIILFDDDK